MSEPLNALQMVVLAAVQGATEFVPISSSGHLVLVRELLGWSDEHGVLVDILLHAASLLAVLLYFRRDWALWLKAFRTPEALPAEERHFYRSLPGYLILATVPVVLFGPPLEGTLTSVRKASIVALIMLGTAVWLVVCERFKPSEKGFSWKTAFVMGAVQVFALLPGASRSGLTTGAGLLMGQRRDQAAKFSFFMALPAVGGAILYETPKMLEAGTDVLNPGLILLGFLVCLLVSLSCIHFCLKFFRSHTLLIFSGYLVAVGLVLLWFG